MTRLIRYMCTQCFSELVSSTEHRDQVSFLEFDYNDSGIYRVHCGKGHESKILLNNEKFEILFDFGIEALRDGYYREAMFNFYSSLEQFYLFSIDFFCEVNRVISDNQKEVRKNVAKRSERQLGAYLYLRLVTMNSEPNSEILHQEESRNRIVHSGFIPEKEDAMKLGKIAFDYIVSEIITYKDKYEEEYREFLGEGKEKRTRQKRCTDIDKYDAVSVISTLNVEHMPSDGMLSFEERLKDDQKITITSSRNFK